MKPSCLLGIVAIVMLSLMSQQVQVRMWGLIMMSKHNLSSADVCTNITSISSLIIFLTDWTLKRWLSWDTTVIVITDWNLRTKAISSCLWLNHYSCVNIKSYLGGGNVASPFPEKVDLLEVVVISPNIKAATRETRDKVGHQKTEIFSLFFTLVVICFLTTRCC